MKILESEFHNYKRLYVSGIRKILYRPQHKMQILLGKNGSGKSSLLKELIPNVDNLKDEYDNDGYKYIKYKHNNDVIEISYDKNSNRHSFKVNDNELNDSGLMKVQKQLIEQYFNINKHIHELLSGTLSFTNMSVNERKRWLTEYLSHIDYTYALSVYDASKNRVKELQHFIKLLRSKMLKDEDLINKYDEKYVEKIKQDISVITEFIKQLTNSIEYIEQRDIQYEYNIAEKMIDDADKLLHTLSNIDINIKDIETELNYKEFSIKHNNELKDKIKRDLEKYENMNITEEDTTVNLKDKLKYIEDEIQRLNTINVYKLDLDTLDKNYLNITSIRTMLDELFSSLHDFKDIIQDIDKYDKLINELNNKSVKLVQLESKIDSMKKEYEKHLKHSDEDYVTCPKCSYMFKPNYNEEIIQDMKVAIDNNIKTYNVLKDDIDNIKKIVERIDKYNAIISNIKELLSNNIYPLYVYLSDITKGWKEIDNLTNILNQFYMDLDELIKYKKYKEEYNEIKHKIDILNNVSQERIKNIFTRLEELRKQYTNIIKENNELTEQLEKLKRIKKNKDMLENYLVKIENFIKRNREYRKQVIITKKNKLLKKLIDDATSIKKQLEYELIEIESVKDRYKKLQEEINDYEKRMKVVKILVDLLSPNKGIIGKSVTKIINDIIERMNDIINDIWTYPLEILPTYIEEKDLTFRFPIKVNRVEVISDISKGSSSMKEVIDLAFKIVAMERLGMIDEYPLILDEFGRTMDKTHRIKAYDYIEEISKNYFSQIFIVSHFESMFARFVNTDVIVLSNDNIDYNGDYNTVVKIN